MLHPPVSESGRPSEKSDGHTSWMLSEKPDEQAAPAAGAVCVLVRFCAAQAIGDARVALAFFESMGYPS
jgi:hypothetical protein